MVAADTAQAGSQRDCREAVNLRTHSWCYNKIIKLMFKARTKEDTELDCRLYVFTHKVRIVEITQLLVHQQNHV